MSKVCGVVKQPETWAPPVGVATSIYAANCGLTASNGVSQASETKAGKQVHTTQAPLKTKPGAQSTPAPLNTKPEALLNWQKVEESLQVPYVANFHADGSSFCF